MPELKKEKIQTLEKPKKEINNAEKKDMPEKHEIATSYVGFPGQEKLVAETLNGDQVEVAFLQGNESIDMKKNIISSFEQQAIANLGDKDAIIKGENAKETTEKTKKEAAEIADLATLFNTSAHEFLAVNPQSVENKGNYNYYFLMIEKNKDRIQNEFRKLGYTIVDYADKGFLVSTDLTKIYFLYGLESQESDKKKKES